MSSLARLPYILEKTPLDKETKLKIIEIFLHSSDEAQLEELMKKLIEWKLSDDAATEELTKQIQALKEDFDKERAHLEDRSQRQTLEVVDHLSSETKIQHIRNRILSLL